VFASVSARPNSAVSLGGYNVVMRASQISWLSSFILAVLLIAAPAHAQEQLVPPEQQLAELLELAQAYQSNYLELAAICCYQIYASTGIIAPDFANGYIAAETAVSALDSSQLLQSCCFTTLSEIIELTPADDELLHEEAGRLLAIITAEGELLEALREVCLEPSELNVVRTEEARRQVEMLLDEYTAADPLPVGNSD